MQLVQLVVEADAVVVGRHQPEVRAEPVIVQQFLLVLELGQARHLERRQLLDRAVDRGLPAVHERVPVLVVEADPRQEDLEPLLDLRRVADLVRGDVDVAVDDAVLDAEHGRDLEHAALVEPDREVARLRRDHVERRHRLREVHAVVEPEAVLLGLAPLGIEEEVVRIHLLPALGAFGSGHVEGAEELRLGVRLGHLGLLDGLAAGECNPRAFARSRQCELPPPPRLPFWRCASSTSVSTPCRSRGSRDPALPSGGLTTSVVSVTTDVRRDGPPVVGYGFGSFGRYAQGGLIRERFAPPPARRRRRARSLPGLGGDDGRREARRPRRALRRRRALDMALWDASAKAAGLPLHRFLADTLTQARPTRTSPLRRRRLSVSRGRPRSARRRRLAACSASATRC